MTEVRILHRPLFYHGCSSYPTPLVGGPEPGWEGNTDKVMYWHGLRMLRYTYYLFACVWKVYLQWGTGPICGVRKWLLYLYIKNETVCRIGSEVHGLYILYIDKNVCGHAQPPTATCRQSAHMADRCVNEQYIHTYIHTYYIGKSLTISSNRQNYLIRTSYTRILISLWISLYFVIYSLSKISF